MALHTWGGRGHRSNCEVTIHPDATAEAKISSQDIGTGTRTVIAIVLADSLGLPLDAVQVRIGDSRLPSSSASGGSTTVGGVSSATRRAALAALDQIFAKAASELNAEPGELEAAEGKIRVEAEPTRFLTWKQAMALFGRSPVVPSRYGNRLAYGHARVNCDVIVSGGLGCSIVPFRLGVPPAIVLVRLGRQIPALS